MTYVASLAVTLAALQAPAVTPNGSDTQVAWQRTLSDAEALSRASGRPLLVCVNMDGEVACETFARRKYRDPAFVVLTRDFVPVIASPVRHNDRDHGPRGERVECPRFGRVTCGEHLRVEGPAYERFFDGKRYAPRHVGVRFPGGSPGSEGEVLFDRFLDSDLGRVDDALRTHGGVGRAVEGPVALLDAGARAELEARFRAASVEGRRELLATCVEEGVPQPGVIRLALHGPDAELRRLAAGALAAAGADDHELSQVDLVVRALGHEEDLGRRERLGALLARRAAGDPRARRELKVNAALGAEPRIDPGRWEQAFAGAGDAGALEESWVLEGRLEELLALRDEDGEDAGRALRIARCYLGLARWGLAEGRGPGFFLDDADTSATRAADLGADPAEVAAVRSQIAWLQFREQEAGDLAEAALLGLDGDADRREAFAVLSVLAASRTRAIRSSQADWEAEWATEALAAYRAIEAHAGSTPAQWASHVDLLNHLNLKGARDRVLDQALARFPDAPEVHERLRSAIIERRGMAQLEEAYRERRAAAPDVAGHDWYTGYATLIVAEDHRRGERWDEAQAAYERAKEHFARSAEENAEYGASCTHFHAMALAGQAQAALEDGQLETAVLRISDAVRLRPESLDTEDGLKRTPLDVLRDVVSAVRAPSRAELRARLARLEQVAPEVWQRVN